MKGAREYALLFSTGQYGRLYIVSSSHARGRTFRIYILPRGEKVIPNGPDNPPRNEDAVQVCGVVDGSSGWNEEYGWLHDGKWQEDFLRLVEERKKELDDRKRQWAQEAEEKERARQKHIQKLLEDY